jgi:hypothetical protein
MPISATAEARVEASPARRAVLSEWILVRFLALDITCLCYATGNFGFLNIFDARRPVQLILVLLLAPFGGVVLSRREWLRDSLWWLTAVTLIAEIFVRRNTSVFFLFDRFTAVFVVALVLSLSGRFSEVLLSAVVTLCAVFSTMVVVQAIVVWLNPGVLRWFVLGFTTSTAGDPLTLGHPLEYLGFTSPGILTVFGHPFARFRSFTSEPSVIVGAFYAPGILALTFPKPLRYAAVPILAFAVALSSSGTVFLSVALSLVAWPALWILRRYPRVAAAAPIVLIICWLLILTRLNVAAMMTSISNALAPFEASYSAVNKTVAGTARLSVAATRAAAIREYWLFGSPIGGAGGFPLHLFGYAGIVGLCLALIVSYRIQRLAAQMFTAADGLNRVAAALFYGLWIQVMGFSEFGWITLTGFLMIALMIRRMERVIALSMGHPPEPRLSTPSVEFQDVIGKTLAAVKRRGPWRPR